MRILPSFKAKGGPFKNAPSTAWQDQTIRGIWGNQKIGGIGRILLGVESKKQATDQ